MKIKFRLTLIIIALMVLVVGSIAAVLINRAAALQTESAYEILEYQSGMFANNLKGQFEAYYDTVQTISHVFNSHETIDASDRRKQFDDMLWGILEGNSQFVALYTVWKPGTIDGNDADFVNDPASDASGNYIPCLPAATAP